MLWSWPGRGQRRAPPQRGRSATIIGHSIHQPTSATKSARSRHEFRVCHRLLRTTGTVHDGRVRNYLSQSSECRVCELKEQCTRAPFRKIARDINEEARDHARALVGTPDLRSRAMSARRSRCGLRTSRFIITSSGCDCEGSQVRAMNPTRRHGPEPKDNCKPPLATATQPFGSL